MRDLRCARSCSILALARALAGLALLGDAAAPRTSSASSPPPPISRPSPRRWAATSSTWTSLARGNQNPHDLEVRPSLMVKVRRADLLVINGLDLDQWAEVVVQGANNPKVLPGTPGRVDASEGLPVLEVPTTQVDRSMGDVHPLGNPHYTLGPGHGARRSPPTSWPGWPACGPSRVPSSRRTAPRSWPGSTRR